tara:strand:+ start:2042 stop:2686 length:645 start_codon:yes stop_codon:yes gene_type:complete
MSDFKKTSFQVKFTTLNHLLLVVTYLLAPFGAMKDLIAKHFIKLTTPEGTHPFHVIGCLITALFGSSFRAAIRNIQHVASLPDNARYIENIYSKEVKENGAKTFKEVYSEEAKLVQYWAEQFRKHSHVICKEGFLIYGGNIDLCLDYIWSEELYADFQNPDKGIEKGLFAFLNLHFASKKGKDDDFKVVWDKLPLAVPQYVLSVKGLSLKKRYK